ncbi:UNVERIFIED_CONTAM: putative late blight resistance proteinR1A-10 [Sesamum radiatum]|uniref:Late blight resistance proteinR1A-10 n=1 Tax=Sesamum radiatum TaxID=300843 RepID=A0AAW2MYE8_SESRA
MHTPQCIPRNTPKNLVLGFDDDLAEIRTRMVGTSFETVSIVGMGGIGLLDSVKLLNTDMQDMEDEELVVHLYKSLRGRRCPIVMDDMWDTEIWDAVFGEGACPLELEEIGKEIARKCGGLPLSVVVIGGLLSKASRTQEY